MQATRDATVTRLTVGDLDELLAAIRRSHDLHYPWVEPPTNRMALERYLLGSGEHCIRYGVRIPSGTLAGVVNVNGIVRGAFQNGFLGFYALVPHQGQGWLRAGLIHVIGCAFGRHELHRLEANVQPGNERSAALVRSLGFRWEGHSLRYLRVAGQWRDHDRYALTAEEWGGKA